MAKKRKDGLRERKITINGKRISIYGHDAEELDLKAAKLRAEAEQGIKADKAMTLDKMFEVWLRNKKNVKPRTIDIYRHDYETIRKHIGSLKLTDITPQTCDNLQEALSKEEVIRNGKKRGTLTSVGINSRMTILNGILKLAVERRLITYNPCSSIKPERRTEKKVTDSTHRALTAEELNLFWSYIKDSDYLNIMRFMASTGLRAGEAGALVWSDISKDSVHVSKTTTMSGGKVVISPTPKTEASFRDVPLTKAAKRVLTEQKKRLMILYGGEALRDDAPVFPKNNGTLTDHNSINAAIRYYIAGMNEKGMKIERFTSHSFRHSFATMAVNQGMQPQTLQKILGHSTITMTMDLYYHSSEEQKQEEASRIEIPV